jgi:hypothetical protein
LALHGTGLWRDRWLQALTKLGQDLRIQLIGLGQLSLRGGKVVGPTRIDDTDGDGRLVQRRDARPFIASRGFTDDVNKTELLEPTHEGAVTRGIVGERTGLRPWRGRCVQVERGLGDIHSDINDGRRHG